MKSTTTDRRTIELPLELGPADVARALREEPGLVVLAGSWAAGEALVTWDPVRRLRAEDPFDVLEHTIDSGGGFRAGWFGVWGYQLGSLIENLPSPPQRPVPVPRARLAFHDFALVRRAGRWWFVTDAQPERIAAVEDALRIARSLGSVDPLPYELGTFTPDPPLREHSRVVERALEHIRAGDVFQTNLCLRLEAGFTGDPLDVFCAGIAALHPAYGAFVRSPEGDVVSFSPELFLRREGREVVSSPIKGTARLDTDPDELAASAKNRAENIMIVDLMRNDLGRVCEPHSVTVPDARRLERHAVWHLVSDVKGRLAKGLTDRDLLRATFPPGSVTGAPKIRAMEVIAGLEATAREAYTGAIGYVTPVRTELNVVIRTFEFRGGRVWLGVGGGIVVASDADAEVVECLTKAEPLIDAVGGTLDTGAWAPGVAAKPHVDRPPAFGARPVPARGVFTTAAVVDGRVLDADAHRERLLASATELGFELGTVWADALAAAAATTGRRRLRVDLGPEPSFSLSELSEDADAWRLETRTVAGGWGAHKWSDRSALDAGDYLLVDESGAILETSRASIFVVRDEGLYTPPLDGRILPGTMRARVIETAEAHGIDVYERRLGIDEIGSALEVFACNAVRGVRSVGEIAGIGSWSPGPLTGWLSRELHPPQDLRTLGRKLAEKPHKARKSWGRGRAPRVLLIDNYDSFVYNVARYIEELGAHADVVRNDELTVDELASAAASGDLTHLIVSPGPGTPVEAGVSVEAIARLGPMTPTLGICLGHQAIGEAYGARIVRAEKPVHGRPSIVWHDGRGVYRDVDGPLVVARYHSLVVDDLPPVLHATAHTGAGIIMGVRHASHPVEGVQWHPESILTRHGHAMLAAFLGGVE